MRRWALPRPNVLAAIAPLARLRIVSRPFGLRTLVDASRPSLPFVIGLILVHVGFALVLIMRAGVGFGSDGIDRYIEIATGEGRPYVDRQVEYMPVDVLVMEMVAVGSSEGSYRAFVAVALAADLGIGAVLAYGWGSATAVRYLLLSLAALPFLFLTTDLVSVFLAVAGIALALRGREALGGVTLAVAVLTKVWPAAVVPALFVAGRRRAVAVACVGAALGFAAWLLYAGVGGPSQVLTFRGAKGWEVESVVGVMVWIALGRTTTVEQGAPRVGTAPTWARLALGAALLFGLVALWRKARWWQGKVEGVPATVAVSLVIACSPLFSLGYVTWLLPWSAIAGDEREHRAFVWACGTAVALTGVMALVYTGAGPVSQPVLPTLILTRNVACLAIIVAWFKGARERRYVEGPAVARAKPDRPLADGSSPERRWGLRPKR